MTEKSKVPQVNTAIHVSVGASKFDNCPVQCEAANFDEFTDDVLVGRGTAKGKTFICAPMAEGYNNDQKKYPGQKPWRAKHLALPRGFLPLDCDGFDSLETYAMLLGYLKRYQGFAYTTASHTPEAPRCRVVLAQSRETDRDEGIALCEAVQAMIDAELGAGRVKFDKKVYPGEQPLYTPLEGAETFRFTGQSVDVDAMLLAPAAKPKGNNGNQSRLEQAKSDDKILHAMIQMGMVRSTEDNERFMIECPFAHEHSMDGGEKETMYCLANTHGHPQAAFSCFHGHCAKRTQPEFVVAVLARYEKEKGDLAAPSAAPKPAPIIAYPEPLPGVAADVVAAILAVANKPQPALTMLAALVAFAAMCGSFYALANGCRLNLYGIGILPTAGGKNLPQMMAKRLAKIGNANVISAPSSGEGLEDALTSNIGTLCVIDEMGHLLALTNAKNAKAWHVSLMRKFLELYAAGADTSYTARGKADKPGRSIPNPALSLIGFTTPLVLGRAISLDDIDNGLAGRLLWVETKEVPKNRRGKKAFVMPKTFYSTAMKIEVNLTRSRLAKDVPVLVDMNNDADALLDELNDEFDLIGRGVGAPHERALCARSLENVEHICGVLAVLDNPDKPVITTTHVEWAAQFVRASNATALNFVEDEMHNGDVQRDAAKIKKLLSDNVFTPQKDRKGKPREGQAIALAAGAVPRALLLKRSGLDAQPFDRAFAHLLGCEDIAIEKFGELTAVKLV